MPEQSVALIVDIVRSKDLADRAAAQHEVQRAFEDVHAAHPFRHELWPTVGDEFQAVFADVADALRATAVARLLLPVHLDCRFGLGQGEIREIGRGATGPVQDGSAWWNARAAVDEAHRREDRSNPYLRTWFASDTADLDAVVNSYLLVRDHAISAMKSRERRLAAGALLGRPQADLAREEGITQSGVSQNLRRSGGAALLAAHELLTEVADR